jgi:hypothetical protein
MTFIYRILNVYLHIGVKASIHTVSLYISFEMIIFGSKEVLKESW